MSEDSGRGRGPLERTLLAMGAFAALAVGVWALGRFGLLDSLPSGAGFVAVIVLATLLALGVSVYRGEHHTERKYPLGTGLSRDTPDPSDFEDDEDEGGTDAEPVDGDADTDAGDGSRP